MADDPESAGQEPHANAIPSMQEVMNAARFSDEEDSDGTPEVPTEQAQANGDGASSSSFPSQLGCPYQRAVGSRSDQSRRRKADNRDRLVSLVARFQTSDGTPTRDAHEPERGRSSEEEHPSNAESRSNSVPRDMRVHGQAPDGNADDGAAAEDGVTAGEAGTTAGGAAPPSPEVAGAGEQSTPSKTSFEEATSKGISSGHHGPLGSKAKFLSPLDTVIIFDWDDTLFPTWFVSDVVVPCLPAGEKWDADAVLPSDSPFAEALSNHAQTVVAVLKTARSIGRVGLVTLAQRPWVLSSAKRFWPGLDFESVLKELDIPIIYARECLKRPMISQAKVEEGVNIFTIAKQAAMLKALKKLYGRNPWKNVISIGDSIVERVAITEVLWGHDQDPDITPCCKTVKLMEEPSPEQLKAELTLLGMWLRSMAAHGEDFDITMDDSEELMVKFHERFGS